ncbi:hypothetical protein, partial [Streptomyces sp. NPDC055080]
MLISSLKSVSPLMWMSALDGLGSTAAGAALPGLQGCPGPRTGPHRIAGVRRLSALTCSLRAPPGNGGPQG